MRENDLCGKRLEADEAKEATSGKPRTFRRAGARERLVVAEERRRSIAYENPLGAPVSKLLRGKSIFRRGIALRKLDSDNVAGITRGEISSLLGRDDVIGWSDDAREALGKLRDVVSKR
jgi:hypothetical protein